MTGCHKQLLALITGLVLIITNQLAFAAIDAFANLFIRTDDALYCLE